MNDEDFKPDPMCNFLYYALKEILYVHLLFKHFEVVHTEFQHKQMEIFPFELMLFNASV